MMNLKQEVLVATAYDYYNHREHIQYDQRSMDRFIQVTPRRKKFFPPEAATSQYALHLDCSAFCSAVYYQAFGYELPNDITWHMYENMEPLIYKYEKTFEETFEDKLEMVSDFAAALEPGDLITMMHQGQSGHIMIYLGNGEFMHCCPIEMGVISSYDYDKRFDKKNRFGIMINKVADITNIITDDAAAESGNFPRYSFFSNRETSVAIHRPLDILGEPTEQAKLRAGAHKGLLSGVESSIWGGQHAALGDTVEYRVKVKNINEESRNVVVEFEAPEHTSVNCDETAQAELAAGEEKIFTFAVTVEDDSAYWLEPPYVTVNGLEIHAKKVLLGRDIPEADKQAVIADMIDELAIGKNAIEAAAKVYGEYGIEMSPDKRSYIRGLFHHFDTCARTDNNVLVRRQQQPYKDMCPYGLFGGKGVVTAEISYIHDIRTTEIRRCDLMAGDIILCSNDPFAKQTYALFYTGDSLIGPTEIGLGAKEMKGEEIDAFINTLFGRFCFIILRPWLKAQDK